MQDSDKQVSDIQATDVLVTGMQVTDIQVADIQVTDIQVTDIQVADIQVNRTNQIYGLDFFTFLQGFCTIQPDLRLFGAQSFIDK